jgi:cobalt-zinc-cadmium efflux system protein
LRCAAAFLPRFPIFAARLWFKVMGGGHHHHRKPAPAGDYGGAFALGVLLNSAFVLVEAGFGLWSQSMALVADAAHNLSDVLSLLIAWGAATMAALPANPRFTYGYKSSSILAALANAGLLLVAIGAILYQTVQRLFAPAQPDGGTMVAVAAVGIVINTATALLFARGRKSDLNIRGAFVHMAADALVSLGVVLAGAMVLWTGADWIDPLTSLLIVIVIGFGSWGLLRDSVKMGLLAVPDGIDDGAVRDYLAGLPGVAAVHDLHIWPMSTTETALTAHLVMPGGHDDGTLHEIAHELDHRFGIGHATVQVERGAHADHCADCA